MRRQNFAPPRSPEEYMYNTLVRGAELLRVHREFSRLYTVVIRSTREKEEEAEAGGGVM